ncbi:MAG TPA: hypothetical protein PLV42_10225 [bacterium]|nr:hypothetical protein [bacterium]
MMMRRYVFALLSLFLFLGVAACSETGNKTVDADAPSDGDMLWGDEDTLAGDELLSDEGDIPEAEFAPDADALATDYHGQTGFVTIEPVTYYLRTQTGTTGSRYTSDEARLWYSFQPADEKMEEKPLAIFFNGGPGSASGLLLAFNTGRKSMDPVFNGGDVVGENPHRWSSFANILYIDARNTGFSYSITGDKPGYTTRNFNPFLDGADFVRVLLRFLAAHPEIQANPVIFAGESYGGTRTIAMQNLLLHPDRYAANTGYYTDTALADEIAAHYAAVFPGETMTVEKRAAQFGYTALIQPLLFGEPQNTVSGELLEEPGSVVYQIAAEEGATFTPCDPNDAQCDKYYNAIMFIDNLGRDLYKYDEQSGWMNDLMTPVVPELLTRLNYADLLGHDPLFIEQMYAAERENAYKLASPVNGMLNTEVQGVPVGTPLHERVHLMEMQLRMMRLQYAANPDDPEEEFRELFGVLDDYDAYYISLNDKVTEAFYRHTIHPFNDLFGELFLENLLTVDTFITQAAFDLVIFSPAIPAAARMFPQVTDVAVADDAFTVTYAADSFDGVAEGTRRTVVWPRYEKAGHSVTVSQPDKYAADVAAWYDALQK